MRILFLFACLVLSLPYVEAQKKARKSKPNSIHSTSVKKGPQGATPLKVTLPSESQIAAAELAKLMASDAPRRVFNLTEKIRIEDRKGWTEAQWQPVVQANAETWPKAQSLVLFDKEGRWVLGLDAKFFGQFERSTQSLIFRGERNFELQVLSDSRLRLTSSNEAGSLILEWKKAE